MIWIMVCITGCSLFPDEVVIDDTLRVEHDPIVEYATVKVERGDIDCSETINIQYIPAETREYYLRYVPSDSAAFLWDFGIASYVVKGDEVKKGQLLVEAPCEELEKQVADYRSQIQTLNLDIEHNNELLNVAPKEEQINYETAIDELKKQIHVLNLRIQEVNVEMQDYRIYADIDGRVTYVADWTQTGVQNSPYIRVTSAEGHFEGTYTGDLKLIKNGDVLTTRIDNKDVELVVQSVEDAGEGTCMAYFTAEGNFSETTKGKAILQGKIEKNVLYLPETAVRSSEGKYYVRIVAEDGFLRAKEVKVSYQGNGYCIIEEGLEEGEEVVNE